MWLVRDLRAPEALSPQTEPCHGSGVCEKNSRCVAGATSAALAPLSPQHNIDVQKGVFWACEKKQPFLRGASARPVGVCSILDLGERGLASEGFSAAAVFSQTPE